MPYDDSDAWPEKAGMGRLGMGSGYDRRESIEPAGEGANKGRTNVGAASRSTDGKTKERKAEKTEKECTKRARGRRGGEKETARGRGKVKLLPCQASCSNCFKLLLLRTAASAAVAIHAIL